MIIKVISDTHNDHHELDQSSLECDILIHCGDFGTKGNFSEAERFLRWFVKRPAKYKLLVPGNHDKRFKSHNELLSRAYEYGIKVLMNEGVDINGYKFWGGHFVPWFKDGKCEVDLETRKSAWKDMPEDVSVLITHVPPRGILDTNVRGEHCGCDQLLAKVNEVRPTYHVFGHIHEHAGEFRELGGVTFLNCCNKNRFYTTTRLQPTCFELPDIV